MHIKVILFLTSLIYLTHVDASKKGVSFFSRAKSEESERSEQSVFVTLQEYATGPVLSYKDQAAEIKKFIEGIPENSVLSYKPDESRYAERLNKVIDELPADKSLTEQKNQLRNAEQLAYLLLSLEDKDTPNLARRVQLSLNNIFLAAISNNYVVFDRDNGILSLPSDSLKSEKEFILSYKGEKIFLMQTDNFHNQSTAVSIDFDRSGLKAGIRQVDNDDCSLFAYWSVLRLISLMPNIEGEELTKFLCGKVLTIYNDYVVIADPNALKPDADESLDNRILAMKYNEPPMMYLSKDKTYEQFISVIQHKTKYQEKFFITQTGRMRSCKLVDLNVEFVDQPEERRLFTILNHNAPSILKEPTSKGLIEYIMMQYCGLVAASKNKTQSHIANLFLKDDFSKQHIQKFGFEFDANKFVESTKGLVDSIKFITTNGNPNYFQDGDDTEVLETVKQYIAYIESVKENA